MTKLGPAANSRDEPSLRASDIARFGRALRGALILPDDPDYEAARKVWNGMVDKKPAMIVRCACAADVVEAAGFARGHGLPVSVRGGGHNVAGSAVCDGGLMIDLSRMKGIQVDPEGRTARAQAGLTIGEFDAATQAFGLGTTMGVNGDTGISGLTLGGGFGKLGSQVRAGVRQPRPRGYRHRGWPAAQGKRDRTRRSGLWHPRRRRQLRCRHGI